MLSLDQIFNKDELKFTSSQVTNGLYKFGHITKEEKDYLDKIDALALIKANRKSKSKEIANFKIKNGISSNNSENRKFIELSMNNQEIAAI
ncbi:hypothetical protein [Lactobacillus helveticus]|uniref:Uncharacterized protein n=1 Tax=Lactobacillus helveticus CIRM-BIA 104 TaxID=1226333 RepID=U6FFA2_LACHE|nr:hypothetical protein [Lactobacillus helveticus]KXN78158.1 hypothetical protein AY470_00940 [Lactobacillus helveticus]MCT3408628.1 hypothetical protein [Lactobacillus helveticus]MCT3424985.1 hypothetical protein [Lactobacillus helveticus]PXZ18701.1 hypothetical protein DM475_08085 [Lactobacillus helveticus]CDI61700.1 Protein of unknown function [Lactobacillus helveticus CIRM-BIA 104]